MDQVLTWVHENTDLLVLAGIVGIVSLVCVYPVIIFSRPKSAETTGKIMVKRAEYEKEQSKRRLSERQLIVDGFEDMLLGLFANGRISQTTYDHWHGKLATALTIGDFVAQRVSSGDVKAMLKSRRNGGTYYGIYEHVAIPGPKPGDKEATAPKHDLEALIRSLKAS